MLFRSDQGELGLLGPGEANADDITGPSCAYVRRTPSDPVVVVGVNVQSGGLEGLYQRRANFQLFEPTALEGYPGLYLNPAGGPEICSLVVAVNAEELLFADAVPGGPSPAPDGLACDQAEQVMTAIFEDLPRGG